MLLIETSDKSSFERTRQFYRKHGYAEVVHIPDFFADAASKAHALSFTEGFAREVRSDGIAVLALCQGPTSTEIWPTGPERHPRCRCARRLWRDSP